MNRYIHDLKKLYTLYKKVTTFNIYGEQSSPGAERIITKNSVERIVQSDVS